MEHKLLFEQLKQNATRIQAFIEGVSTEQGRWKPDPQSWSILEVTNHLYDEEREDFRAHLRYILSQTKEPWPSIDPQGWVTVRGYNQRELKESLKNFLAEREGSLAWLSSLQSPDWNAAVQAPWGGQISAGDMLSSWVAHDQLHMRQFVELHRAYLLLVTEPYHVEYAGKW